MDTAELEKASSSPQVVAAADPGHGLGILSPYVGRVEGATAEPVGKRVVFLDFGHGKIFALLNDGDEVLVFDNLAKLVEELRPSVIVLDSLSRTQQNVVAELARTGVAFMRLKQLKRLADERKNNGLCKSDENDVKLLREIFRRDSDAFQPLFSSPEELEVRELTELWVTMAGIKKAAKLARTATKNPVAIETHIVVSRQTKSLSKEIHRKALEIPLYRRAYEVLGLKGPALAYIVSHVGHNLTILSKDRLAIRYGVTTRPYKKRPLRSHLLILLAYAAILHKHPKYRSIHDYYRRQKNKRSWSATLHVALILLRDLRRLAQKTGPPA